MGPWGRAAAIIVPVAVLSGLVLAGLASQAEPAAVAACTPGNRLLGNGQVDEAEKSYDAVLASASADSGAAACAQEGLAGVARFRCAAADTLFASAQYADAATLYRKLLVTSVDSPTATDCGSSGLAKVANATPTSTATTPTTAQPERQSDVVNVTVTVNGKPTTITCDLPPARLVQPTETTAPPGDGATVACTVDGASVVVADPDVAAELAAGALALRSGVSSAAPVPPGPGLPPVPTPAVQNPVPSESWNDRIERGVAGMLDHVPGFDGSRPSSGLIWGMLALIGAFVLLIRVWMVQRRHDPGRISSVAFDAGTEGDHQVPASATAAFRQLARKSGVELGNGQFWGGLTMDAASDLFDAIPQAKPANAIMKIVLQRPEYSVTGTTHRSGLVYELNGPFLPAGPSAEYVKGWRLPHLDQLESAAAVAAGCVAWDLACRRGLKDGVDEQTWAQKRRVQGLRGMFVLNSERA